MLKYSFYIFLYPFLSSRFFHTAHFVSIPCIDHDFTNLLVRILVLESYFFIWTFSPLYILITSILLMLGFLHDKITKTWFKRHKCYWLSPLWNTYSYFLDNSTQNTYCLHGGTHIWLHATTLYIWDPTLLCVASLWSAQSQQWLYGFSLYLDSYRFTFLIHSVDVSYKHISASDLFIFWNTDCIS